jgi:TolA-binding protein
MAKKSSLLVILFLLLGFAATCQKVKYKDLFVLLNAKQYDDAEPFLRKYLKDNDDNPNAYLFMGNIFQEKSVKNDVLKYTEGLISNIDSAIYFYDIAYKSIDEREIKRNDEYYQAYNRRDLRTGKFGVKLSDVQFDLEKRMEGLKEKKNRVRLLNQHFKNAESLYAKSNFLFKDFQLRYKDTKSLFLRSNDSTMLDLARLAQVFDSSMNAFNSYKTTSQLLGNTGYNQVASLAKINDFSNDGKSGTDFMVDNLKLWDYKSWATATREAISNEVKTLREQLIAFDIEINKLREKLKNDSVSIAKDLEDLKQKDLETTVKKFDADPMPLDLFGMKISELEYASSLLEHKPLRDSVNVNLQIENLNKEVTYLRKFDELTKKLKARDMDEDAMDYAHFITSAYGTSNVLKSLVNASNEYAQREMLVKEEELQRWQEALRWILTETDSIPLFLEVAPSSKYHPLVLKEEKYTAGLQYTDSFVTGYFYSIKPSHRPDVAVTFPVNKENFSKRMIPVIKGMSASDDTGQVFYVVVYSQEKQGDKFPMTVAKIYKTDGLAWVQDILLDLLPTELTYNSGSGELSIKTSATTGESKLVILDKGGKLLQ